MRLVDGRRAGPTPFSEWGRVEYSLIETHLSCELERTHDNRTPYAVDGTRPSAPHDQRTSSAPSARPKEKAPGSYYPPATVKPWPFIWRKSRLRSRPARTPSFFLIRRDGMSRRGFQSQTTSRSCRCRRNRPSSIRLRTSGNSCATIGSRTASSNPTTIAVAAIEPAFRQKQFLLNLGFVE